MIRKCLTIQLAVEAEQDYIASLSPEAREQYLAKKKIEDEKYNDSFKEARERMKQNKDNNEGL